MLELIRWGLAFYLIWGVFAEKQNAAFVAL
jgi:hypothetical protein